MATQLNLYDYANIFSVFTDADGYSYYDLLNNLIIQGDIDPVLYDEIFYNETTSWYELSHKYYGTTRLWWTILIANNIVNPFTEAKTGTRIKILKKEVISEILSNINN
jgi:hypothetical protein